VVDGVYEELGGIRGRWDDIHAMDRKPWERRLESRDGARVGIVSRKVVHTIRPRRVELGDRGGPVGPALRCRAG
jgi:hypothetical protein